MTREFEGQTIGIDLEDTLVARKSLPRDHVSGWDYEYSTRPGAEELLNGLTAMGLILWLDTMAEEARVAYAFAQCPEIAGFFPPERWMTGPRRQELFKPLLTDELRQSSPKLFDFMENAVNDCYGLKDPGLYDARILIDDAPDFSYGHLGISLIKAPRASYSKNPEDDTWVSGILEQVRTELAGN